MKIFKEIGYYFMLVFITFSLVMVSFSASIGVRPAFESLVLGITHLGFVAEANKGEVTELKSEITGTGDEKYEDLDLSGYTVEPVNIVAENAPPLIIPTNGIAGHANFVYDPVIHPGVDIWSNSNGKGVSSDLKGYPVISACAGVVGRVFHPNEEIEIYCDKLPDYYKDMVPSLEIKILYSHMGDAITKEPFHNLKVGQRLKKGEFVGYQGAVSSHAPQNRVVHLHFGVYNLKTRKPIDPTSYIGVSATTLGQVFTMGKVAE